MPMPMNHYEPLLGGLQNHRNHQKTQTHREKSHQLPTCQFLPQFPNQVYYIQTNSKKKICVAITVCPKNHSHLRAATGHLFRTTPQRGRHRQVGRPVAPGAGHPWLKNMVWSPLAAITWRNLRVSTSLFKS